MQAPYTHELSSDPAACIGIALGVLILLVGFMIGLWLEPIQSEYQDLEARGDYQDMEPYDDRPEVGTRGDRQDVEPRGESNTDCENSNSTTADDKADGPSGLEPPRLVVTTVGDCLNMQRCARWTKCSRGLTDEHGRVRRGLIVPLALGPPKRRTPTFLCPRTPLLDAQDKGSVSSLDLTE
jgi:hypothetical protein